MEQSILSHFENHVYTIILNKPESLNCIGREMLYQLEEHLTEIENNDDIKVVVIKGADRKSFSSGGDLKEFNKLSKKEITEWITLGNNVFNHLESIPKPTIAVIQGYAYGGGLELALACDIRLASENASFCSPELSHGWLPGWGGMTRLKRLVGETKTKEIVFLSEPMNADKAYEIGLLNKVINTDKLETELNNIIEKLCHIDNAVLGFAKYAISDNLRQTSGVDVIFDVLATLYSKNNLNKE